MGNGIRKLSICFAGDAGEISRRRNDIAVCFSDPLDEGLGHSFCYIPSDHLHKSQPLDDPPAAVFRTISGAAISANTSTPLSTDPFPYASTLDKASTFESSNFFSSIPLQPIPRNSFHTARSGPITRSSGPGSDPAERGFMSGPIERSFISGPLDNNHHSHRYRPSFKKIANLKKVVTKSFWSFSREINGVERERERENHIINNNNNTVISGTNSGISSTITSHNLSSELSLVDESDDGGNESFGAQNLQWAQGKAGEDRVHIVISEENGWVFVGIYDGFNGPDATDFLLNNLYANVHKELKGLLWCDRGESCESTADSSWFLSKSLDGKERMELDRRLREKLSSLGSDGDGADHCAVLKALSEALRKTEASYLEIADMMLAENPELALMGSCVLVMVMKGDDVYLMNVGDSRAVLAQRNEGEGESQGVRRKKDCDESIYGYECDSVDYLIASQLTMDHSTSVKEVENSLN